MKSQKESELKEFLIEIGDAIREVKGTKDLINAQDMREEILGLGAGGLPIEVATEEEMNALLTSGVIGAVYKYTGTTGTYENGALYLLEEEAEDELAGTWVFNEELNLLSGITLTFNAYPDNSDYVFNFITPYYAFDIWGGQYCNGISFLNDYNVDEGQWIVYHIMDDEGKWRSSDLQTIVIKSKLAEVENGDVLLSWLKANATKQ